MVLQPKAELLDTKHEKDIRIVTFDKYVQLLYDTIYYLKSLYKLDLALLTAWYMYSVELVNHLLFVYYTLIVL